MSSRVPQTSSGRGGGGFDERVWLEYTHKSGGSIQYCVIEKNVDTWLERSSRINWVYGVSADDEWALIPVGRFAAVTWATMIFEEILPQYNIGAGYDDEEKLGCGRCFSQSRYVHAPADGNFASCTAAENW
ncbi:hypothetical protein FKW77_010414 [Venturia effusa]|uniref:Uncharacterized protein n=1 Tax=Venturia effusa TaxID=50376 RepID=A0A517KXR4_9PEZI|nr:hypothetical protein FKW77_010414 [Venturia effusa]